MAIPLDPWGVLLGSGAAALVGAGTYLARAFRLDAERRRATRAVSTVDDMVTESRAVVSAVIASLGDPVAVIDRTQRLVAYNPAYVTFVRDALAGASGAPTGELAAPEAAGLLARMRLSWERALAGESFVDQLTVQPGEPDEAFFECTFAPVHGAGATPTGAIQVIRDVTPRVRALAQQIEIAAERTRHAARVEEAMRAIVEVMGRTMEARDPFTAGHQHGVARLAVAIGTELGMDPFALEGLRLAAEVHDIGKIQVPQEILARPRALSEVEGALVQAHAEIGFEILRDVAFPWPIADMVRQHHERLDGSGYPHGLVGDQIMGEARVLAVADVITAMTAHRPYRPAMPIEAALAELRAGAGRRYDPAVVAAAEAVVAAGFAGPHDGTARAPGVSPDVALKGAS